MHMKSRISQNPRSKFRGITFSIAGPRFDSMDVKTNFCPIFILSLNENQ